jgi:hypothetical protein
MSRTVSKEEFVAAMRSEFHLDYPEAPEFQRFCEDITWEAFQHFCSKSGSLTPLFRKWSELMQRYFSFVAEQKKKKTEPISLPNQDETESEENYSIGIQDVKDILKEDRCLDERTLLMHLVQTDVEKEYPNADADIKQLWKNLQKEFRKGMIDEESR